jgi:hypothetical protein
MSKITVTKKIVEMAPGPNRCVSRHFYYIGKGLELADIRSVTSESDFSNELYRRVSPDNGKTWGEWEDIYRSEYVQKGDDEIMTGQPVHGYYNPVHDHFVTLTMQRIFDGGHVQSYKLFWGEAKKSFHDHCFLYVSKDGKNWSKGQLVKYEEGADYDEDRWNDPDYLWKNDAYMGTNLQVLANGDILFAIDASLMSCCRILGIDVMDIFPSCPQIMRGLIICRGVWNKEKNLYDLSFSKPVVISDLKSSRSVNEPIVYQLDSGRIVAIFRGSNIQSKNWNTRIEKGTPAHKWYTYSDDGGKTFTDPVPWHYNNGEVFYSPATISNFFRSSKNNKLYWIGNITGPEAYGNAPRYPLVIVEVDQVQGLLLKDTFTIIDDRDPEKDAESLQLSNFSILENRETLDLEVCLTRLGSYKGDLWRSDAYKYIISFS